RSVQCHDAIDDMLRARLIGGIAIGGLGRRLEWAYDDPRRIGVQMKSLPVEEYILCQNASTDLGNYVPASANCAVAPVAGSVNVNAAPFPTWASAVIVPPCRSMMR